MMAGVATAFSLWNLSERATFFIEPTTPVYEGMVVGENARPGDMEVNVTKGKKLTNMRTTSSDENIQLEPPREIGLEDALGYIADDELIEVTPKSVRLRKRLLSASDRKKASRASA
jgi:GTP-binding protein